MKIHNTIQDPLKRSNSLLFLLLKVLGACTPGSAEQIPASIHPATLQPVATVEILPSATLTATITSAPTSSPLPSVSPTATPPGATATPPGPTATPPGATATFAILRGVVNVDKLSCRYGPGAMYLYLYGMVRGATQDIIGRTDSGKWLLTRAHGDNKACWVNAEFMDIQGDVMSVEMVYPEHYSLPQSNQGYRPLWDVVAIRKGNEVVISWKSEARRPGDEESPTSVLYVVETWVCRGGQVWFTPLGAYTPQVTVTDEPGCLQASHGRVFFVEKHGYTGPTQINWPPAN